MSDIGPQIPAHLLKEYNADRDDDAGAREEEEEDGEGGAAIGPVLPSSLKRRRDSDENEEEPDIGPSIGPVLPSSSSKATQQKEDPDSDSDEDDDYMPALPPELIAQRESGPEPPKKRVAGPAMPPPSSSHQQHYRRSYSDDEDDDLVGPRPDLAAVEFDTEEYEALVRREEIEARARKAREGDKEEKVERGEWMLVPPEAKKLGMTIDHKPRGFSKTAVNPNVDRSGWTDTPADKERKALEAQRNAGQRKKPKADDDEPQLTQRDIEQARIAAQFNKSRGESLLDSYTKDYAGSKSMDKDDASKRGFDRDKDLVGRRVDPKMREKMIEQSRELDSKFGRGRYL